jgi:potassium-transporting ATPase potassium-binding subunit
VSVYSILEIVVFCALVVLITKPLGVYMYRVFAGERTFMTPVVRPVERLIYRICGVDAEREMRWTSYTIAMLAFNLVGVLLLYLILRLQGIDILSPGNYPGMRPDLAFNVAVSFTTNTNWQSYVPEQSITYVSQAIGLTVQNFASAATGIALAIALIRGLTRHSAREIGNFWVDMVRSTLYILLPISIVLAVVLVSQGTIQNLHSPTKVKTLEGQTQTIQQGPVASQEAIKELGTNGGGYMNANSSHPYENPTGFSNLLEMLAIFAVAAGLTYTFGRMAGDQKQGWVLFGASAILFLGALGVVLLTEQLGNPNVKAAGVNQAYSSTQAGGNMEGKEVRFGIAASGLWGVVTTDTSCGAVNSMHDSYTPLAGGMVMMDMALGELVFGGVGAGMLGIIVFAVLTVFIAGLMVGRTPEYLGKKIEAKETKMAVLAVMVLEATVLGFAALAIAAKTGQASILNAGPHGLSEILYAYTEGVGNNGSAFAGLSANTTFYNSTIGMAMLFGRFLYIIPIMAIAGSMVEKKVTPPSAGTFRTNNGLFVGLLIAVIIIVGALTFFPAYALGPIVEHILMYAHKLF